MKQKCGMEGKHDFQILELVVESIEEKEIREGERNQRGRSHQGLRSVAIVLVFGRRLGSPSNGRHPNFRIDLSRSFVGERDKKKTRRFSIRLLHRRTTLSKETHINESD
ncbi:hypothetical protein I3843_12G006900 [Carya illinoinensis]|nr:hypothetical protein I3843_12G006900 [Carya illinoinensis]